MARVGAPPAPLEPAGELEAAGAAGSGPAEDISLLGIEDEVASFEGSDVLRAVIEQGLSPDDFASRYDAELRESEVASVHEYVLESENLVELHKGIAACDELLAGAEAVLGRFQSDLGGLSSEIRALQARSQTLAARLGARAELRTRLAKFVSSVAVTPALVAGVLEAPAGSPEFSEAVAELGEKLAFVAGPPGAPGPAQGASVGDDTPQPPGTPPGLSRSLAGSAASTPRAGPSHGRGPVVDPFSATGAPHAAGTLHAAAAAAAQASALGLASRTSSASSSLAAVAAAATGGLGAAARPGDVGLPADLDPRATPAARDVAPELARLRAAASTKAREFLLGRIYDLRRPKTNVQIKQNALLRHADLRAYLARQAPPLAREVRLAYVDKVSGKMLDLFRAYWAVGERVHERVLGETDLLGAAVVGGAVPSAAAMPAPGGAGGGGGGLLASLWGRAGGAAGGSAAPTRGTAPPTPRRATPVPSGPLADPSEAFALRDRATVLARVDAPPLVLHALEAEGRRVPLETLFRSTAKLLVDTAAHEYLFCQRFWGEGAGADARAAAAGRREGREAYVATFGRVLAFVEGALGATIADTHDPLALLLLLRLVRAFQILMARRAVPALDAFFDRLNLALWPRLKASLDAQLASVAGAPHPGPGAPGGPAATATGAAALSAGIQALVSGHGAGAAAGLPPSALLPASLSGGAANAGADANAGAASYAGSALAALGAAAGLGPAGAGGDGAPSAAAALASSLAGAFGAGGGAGTGASTVDGTLGLTALAERYANLAPAMLLLAAGLGDSAAALDGNFERLRYAVMNALLTASRRMPASRGTVFLIINFGHVAAALREAGERGLPEATGAASLPDTAGAAASGSGSAPGRRGSDERLAAAATPASPAETLGAAGAGILREFDESLARATGLYVDGLLGAELPGLVTYVRRAEAASAGAPEGSSLSGLSAAEAAGVAQAFSRDWKRAASGLAARVAADFGAGSPAARVVLQAAFSSLLLSYSKFLDILKRQGAAGYAVLRDAVTLPALMYGLNAVARSAGSPAFKASRLLHASPRVAVAGRLMWD